MQISANTQPGTSQDAASQGVHASGTNVLENSLKILNETFAGMRNDPNEWSSSLPLSAPSTPPASGNSNAHNDGDIIANSGDVYLAKEMGAIESVKYIGSGVGVNPDLNGIAGKAKGCRGNIVANHGDYFKADGIKSISLKSYYASGGNNNQKNLDEILKLAENAQGNVYANGGDVLIADTITGSITMSYSSVASSADSQKKVKQ